MCGQVFPRRRSLRSCQRKWRQRLVSSNVRQSISPPSLGGRAHSLAWQSSMPALDNATVGNGGQHLAHFIGTHLGVQHGQRGAAKRGVHLGQPVTSHV